MATRELISVVKPPEHPLEAGPKRRWPSIQSSLGTKLPRDFRDFGLTYGTGVFVHQGIWVFNAFAAVFPQRMDDGLNLWRSLKEAEGDEEVPFPVFPEEGGLLPWGDDENGAGTFWLTEGNVDKWPIVVTSRDKREYRRFDMELTTFLAKVMALEILLPAIWPKEMFKDPARLVFKPLTIRPHDPEKMKTVYQLYVENGNRAGFWVRHEVWTGEGTEFRIASVDGKSKGRLSGEPLDYGGGTVIVDVYVNGTLSEEHTDLPVASEPGWEIVKAPDWYKS